MQGLADDTVSVMLRFSDGSIGTIHYFANGSKSFPKERVEVFAGGRVLQLDNYRTLKAFGWPGFSGMKLWRQDKGQVACAKAFMDAIQVKNTSPIPIEDILHVSRLSIEISNYKA
jgi:predicted dehydrogenase